jgi:hypothetical protein
VSKSDFGYLASCDGCCDDATDFLGKFPRREDSWIRKISYGRYLAVNRKNFFAAMACALLTFSMLGCGTSNKLQSIQLSASNTSAAPPGTLELSGEGATAQLYLWGNYSDGKQKLLNAVGGVSYQIVVTPGSSDQFGDALPTPPNSVTVSANGLLTAVPPFICTFTNSAVPPATTPSWGLSGSYSITATYAGFMSPPVFVADASQAGLNANGTNPTGECGPPPSK